MNEKQVVSVNGPKGELQIGGSQPLVMIAGPCVIESRDHCLTVATEVAAIMEKQQMPFVFKASFDKANRTSSGGYRGAGMEEGLRILEEVRKEIGCPVISDVHAPEQARAAASVLDILQIPAFLCRQSDLLEAAGATKTPVMIKKGQFLHPSDMQYAAQKVNASGGDAVLLCERGACFGYRELVVDFRSLSILSDLGYPVVFDATHSVQVMGGKGGSSGGQRKYVPLLARAAVAAGVNAIFLETHPTPDTAPSDGPNMVPLSELESLVRDLKKLSTLELETRT